MDTLCNTIHLRHVIRLLVGLLCVVSLFADSVESVAQIAREKDLQNRKKHQELLNSGSVKLDIEEQEIGAALHHYHYDDDGDALSLLKDVLNSHGVESQYAQGILSQIKLDANTAHILYDYAANSSSRYRSLALIRLGESPKIDGIKQVDLLNIEKLFEDIDGGMIEGSSSFRIRAKSAYQRFKMHLEERELSKSVITDLQSVGNLSAPGIANRQPVETQSNHPVDSLNQAPFHPIQEPKEQSFAWWLWLSGVVVVILGLSLLLRFKK
jgi:hypothetical protein